MSTVIGIDWGPGQDKAACIIFRIDGKDVLVQESFVLEAEEVAVLEELDAPKDIVISDGFTTSMPASKAEVNEAWLREAAEAIAEPEKLNRDQRRKREKDA